MISSQEKVLDELIAIVRDSPLSDDDKSMWFNAIKDTSPELWEVFLRSLEGNSQLIVEATVLLKQKVNALKTGDEEAWKKILDNEEHDLENI